MNNCAAIKRRIGGQEECYASKLSANEMGKSITLTCQSKDTKICRVKLDGCLMPPLKGKKRCDYVFIREKTDSSFEFYFVELKGRGTNAEEALEQLLEGIKFIKTKMEEVSKNKIWGIIVGGGDTNGMNRLKERFKKEIGGELKHNTGERCEYFVH